MKSDFVLAFNEIAETRKLPRDIVMSALKAALVSAYRRNAGVSSQQNVEVRMEEGQGSPAIWVDKEVVESVHTTQTEVTLEDARKIYPDVQLGDLVLIEDTPEDFGRIAAQTAKQVILQRMREAERDSQFKEYQDRVGEIVTGTVQSDAGDVLTLSLGRAEAILPRSQQIHGERYRIQDKVRAYVMEVRKTNRGPQIVLSRTHKNMLRRLIEYEVPEIYNGTVEIKSIAREPGARSKIAVAALVPGADPVGACVGMKGIRIQSIVRELNGEKIDVIPWSTNAEEFISKALSPARVSGVFLDDDPDEGRTAVVVVPDDQLSLAIGREGQNARLAAKLTGWRIDIKSITEAASDALSHLRQDAGLKSLAVMHTELMQQADFILQKKAAGKVINPEDYQTFINIVNVVEGHRLEIREDERADRRAQRDAARARVPASAFDLALGESDLPLSVFTALSEANYENVGSVMEQYYVSPERFYYSVEGFNDEMLAAIERLVASVEAAPVPTLPEEVIEVEMAEDTLTAEADIAPELIEVPMVVEEPEALPLVEEDADDPDETYDLVEAEDELDDDEREARARRAALVARIMTQGGAEASVPAVVPAEEVVPVAAAASADVHSAPRDDQKARYDTAPRPVQKAAPRDDGGQRKKPQSNNQNNNKRRTPARPGGESTANKGNRRKRGGGWEDYMGEDYS